MCKVLMAGIFLFHFRSPGMDDFSSPYAPMQKPYFCNEMRPRFTWAYTGSLTTLYHSKVLNRHAWYYLTEPLPPQPPTNPKPLHFASSQDAKLQILLYHSTQDMFEKHLCTDALVQPHDLPCAHIGTMIIYCLCESIVGSSRLRCNSDRHAFLDGSLHKLLFYVHLSIQLRT